MDWYIVLAIVIVLAIIIFALYRARHGVAETLSAQEQCGITGNITLPVVPLARYDYYADKDCVNFARIGTATGAPTGSARADYIARKCDETVGCVAFNMDGALLSGILPSQTWTLGPGLFVRKCVIHEPLYVEIFKNDGFDSTGGRTLLPPGDYSDMNALASYSGIIVEGNMIGRARISSLRVPVGLRAVVYDDKNFTGRSITFSSGAYPSLRNYVRAGNLLYWNNAIASMRVKYDSCANVAGVAGGATSKA